MVAQLAHPSTPPNAQSFGQVAPLVLHLVPTDPWAARPPTIENIAYGTHRCAEARLQISTASLSELGACSDRFTRFNEWSANTAGAFSHDDLDDALDANRNADFEWMLIAISACLHRDSTTIEGNWHIEDLLTIQAAMHSYPLEELDMSPAMYLQKIASEHLAQSLVARPAQSELVEQILVDMQMDFAHALVELVHHDFVTFPEATDQEPQCCEEESPGISFTTTMRIVCACGAEDDVEVTLPGNVQGTRRARNYYSWDCPDCSHSHDIELPQLDW